MRVILFARVAQKSFLNQGFYIDEINSLKQHENVECFGTNSLRSLWRENFDGLVCYFYSYSVFACLIARLKGKPAVVTGGAEQIFYQFSKNRLHYNAKLALFFLTLLSCTRIFAVSSTDLARMKSLSPRFLHHKIELCFHGVQAIDEKRDLDPQLRQSWTFTTICGMDTQGNIERKGLFRAIDALSILSSRRTETQMTIIGRDTERSIVEEYARKKGFHKNLVITGYISEDEKRDILQATEFYIQPSSYEGFGVGALEALAWGCKVIHTGEGGLADTIASFGLKLQRDRWSSISGQEFEDLLERFTVVHPDAQQHLAQFSASRRALAIIDELACN